jgi:ATP-dependent DNA ligase
MHEIKHDGYRLIVQREGKRVRLLTRNGHDWSNRYPLIVEAALRNRQSSFVIDREAVLLGVDGVSDFNGLHSRRHDAEVQLYSFDILALGGEDLRTLPLSLRKTNLARLLARAGRKESSLPRSNMARSDRTYSGRPASSDWRAWFPSAGIDPIAPAGRRIGSR